MTEPKFIAFSKELIGAGGLRDDCLEDQVLAYNIFVSSILAQSISQPHKTCAMSPLMIKCFRTAMTQHFKWGLAVIDADFDGTVNGTRLAPRFFSKSNTNITLNFLPEFKSMAYPVNLFVVSLAAVKTNSTQQFNWNDFDENAYLNYFIEEYLRFIFSNQSCKK